MDPKALAKAFHANQLSLAVLDSTVNELSLDNDKVILANESFDAYESGIRIAYSLYKQTGDTRYYDDSFRLADQSKGLILLENLRLVNRFGGINPEWLEKEKVIKSELFLTEQSLYKTESTSTSGGEHSLREHYADLKREYASLITKIKNEAPDYYKLRFDHHVITPQQVQNNLVKPGEALIEFFVGDSSLTIFGFSKTKRFIDQKKLTSTFPGDVTHLRNLLTDFDGNILKDLQKISASFYEFLLKDCMTALGTQTTSLIVVPDGMLGFIPFEVFTTTEGSEPKYLADNFSIRYAHSASYLLEQTQKPEKKARKFFAGFVVASGIQMTGSRSAAGALAGAKREIASIADLVGTESVVFESASKKDFLSEAPKYKVLHLAMHSFVNNQNPMLSEMAFAPSESDSVNSHLTAIELYNVQLNAEMAVLSACETGVGTLHRGEGIMSFSRAFAYAGVPSSVISLWKVPDKATAKIMTSFYNYLKKGKNKAEALRLAKMDLVRNYPAMMHPYYWSGFILTGDNAPLEFPTLLNWFLVTIGIVGALALFYVGKRIYDSRRKRRSFTM
jgi:CHAT domain-containing protein